MALAIKSVVLFAVCHLPVYYNYSNRIIKEFDQFYTVSGVWYNQFWSRNQFVLIQTVYIESK